jgi:hypothetical protein
MGAALGQLNCAAAKAALRIGEQDRALEFLSKAVETGWRTAD